MSFFEKVFSGATAGGIIGGAIGTLIAGPAGLVAAIAIASVNAASAAAAGTLVGGGAGVVADIIEKMKGDD